MAHHTLKSSYSELVRRINLLPQGAPSSELLYRILQIIFTEKEAGLIARLPVRPFSAERAARIWKIPLVETRKLLEAMAGKALLVDIEQNGEQLYVLPPPMAGFFEFSLMRIRQDIDQKALSELFYQYMNVEEDFIKSLFCDGETQLGRTFVHEPALSEENALFVLDYERASEVIKTASHRAVGICYCRHKMEHLNRACDAPREICMTFNNSAASLSKHGHARQIDVQEGLDLLQEAYDHHLVQFGENVRQSVNFICNCCSCCCEALLAARRFAVLNPIHTSNFLPEIRTELCTGCGKCVEICPVEAMTLISANDPVQSKRKLARVDESRCLGCGLCVRSCSTQALSLKSREKRVITPVNGAHKVVVMAIERGKLQNLIFDNQVLWSHRALATLLGVVLKLPPLQQILASRQLKSRYLETIMQKLS
ncbi:MAG: 4Fe-4S binding protein [Candidatus Cloacimonetes bacterium]|nr:4Fe-4S binding protein [Candidatus Cloacimonadota bacterium]